MHTTTVAKARPLCIDAILCLEAKDNEEERDNHSIVSLNEYISLRGDLSISRLTKQSPNAHAFLQHAAR